MRSETVKKGISYAPSSVGGVRDVNVSPERIQGRVQELEGMKGETK
jgi:hypothetical protein